MLCTKFNIDMHHFTYFVGFVRWTKSFFGITIYSNWFCAEFQWDDVKVDNHRKNYLGHSIKAPVGRWQKGMLSVAACFGVEIKLNTLSSLCIISPCRHISRIIWVDSWIVLLMFMEHCLELMTFFII
ncbi:hypothetical protein Dimus_001933 [Dionaea muscipula]